MAVKIRTFIVFTLISLLIENVSFGQSLERTFQGQILSVEDSLPIPFVNVYTEGYEKFASSSAMGYFSISIVEGDTLNFSAVGFRPRQLIAFTVSGIEQKIYLTQVTYELPGLTIFGRNAMEGFYDHNRLYNPETEKTFNEKFPKPSLGIGNRGAAVTGLFTLLANQFNSEYQQLKKLRKIEKDEYSYFRRLELIYTRLSPDYIIENTSLNKEEVESFLDFWSPSLDFMEKADGYQLLAAIQEKEVEYIRQLKSDNKGKNVVSTIELRKLLEEGQGN